jgi:hypothetical protein
MLLKLMAMDLEAAVQLRRSQWSVRRFQSTFADAVRELEQLAKEVRQLIGSSLEMVLQGVFEDVCQTDVLEWALDLENEYLQSIGFSHHPLCGTEYVERIVQLYKEVLTVDQRGDTDKPIASSDISISVFPGSSDRQLIRRLKALRRKQTPIPNLVGGAGLWSEGQNLVPGSPCKSTAK